jgi:formylglycine-generating enzyme required for sulfatase activity
MPNLQPVIIQNGSGLRLRLILAGELLMGEPWFEDSRPAHRVRLSRPFYIGIFTVTQKEWAKVMRTNPSKFKGSELPVENVGWEDCQQFIRGLNDSDPSGRFRLPTEAEWEHACRAGSRTIFSFGDDERDLANHGWFRSNSKGQTHPVGQKKPNAWGLYDMHGNVCEWCADWYDPEYYRHFCGDETVENPAGPEIGFEHVVRGGSWDSDAMGCYSGVRSFALPDTRKPSIGFRLAKDAIL